MTTGAARIVNFLALFSALLPLKIKADIFDPPSIEGNWSSGGGEILEQSRNPWFLEGVPSAALHSQGR